MCERRGKRWWLCLFTGKHSPRHDELNRKYTRRSPRSLRAWWEVYLCGCVRHSAVRTRRWWLTPQVIPHQAARTRRMMQTIHFHATFSLLGPRWDIGEVSRIFWTDSSLYHANDALTLSALVCSPWAAVEPEVVSLLIRISLWDLTLIKKWINYPSWQPWYAAPAVTQWVVLFFFVKEVIVFIHYTQRVKTQSLSFCLSHKLCLHTGNV